MNFLRLRGKTGSLINLDTVTYVEMVDNQQVRFHFPGEVLSVMGNAEDVLDRVYTITGANIV